MLGERSQNKTSNKKYTMWFHLDYLDNHFIEIDIWVLVIVAHGEDGN